MRLSPLHRRALAVAAALLASSAAPLRAQAPQPAPAADAAPMPSATLPPALDRVLRDYERAWKAGDAAALAELFAEDGFVLQNGRAPVRGRAAIRAAYAGQAGGELRLRAYAYSTSDTLGYMVGGYAYGSDPADVGKWTLTLRRARGGRWLIFSDMDNMSRSPRRPAQGAPAGPPPGPPTR
jgi:ketosteroid isomerase-like protein